MVLFAHINQDRGETQPLSVHSEQVARYCADFCRAIGLEALGGLTGLLHDAGKASHAFQEYLAHPERFRKGEINHSACGARFLAEEFGMDRSPTSLVPTMAAASICGHHSGLPDCTSAHADDALRERLYPVRPIEFEPALQKFLDSCADREQIHALYEAAHPQACGLLRKIWNFCKTRVPEACRKEQYNFSLGLMQRYLHSCLVDADRYDTYLFEIDKAPPAREPPGWEALSETLESYLRTLPQNTALNRTRAALSQSCAQFARRGPGIYQLYIPTGGGKTFSSLRFALQCAAQHKMEHIFYIAPYKTILEQNAQEIRRVLNADALILEHHGDAIPDSDHPKNQDEMNRYSLLTQRWDAPIILTSMAQFLLTLFSGRSGSVRRFHALANSVIILDEVQSVPVKFVSMLNTALNFLAHICGCAVVLCTATQPQLQAVPVPVVLSEPAQMAPPEQTQADCFARTKVVDETGLGALSPEEFARKIAEEYHEKGSVLAIVNTKTAARQLEEALRTALPGARIYCLTTLLCPANRMALLEEIKTSLKQGRPLVCVSTQLIEAGVDISFPTVFRTLAGLDSIAQAAGRCNRNGEADYGCVHVVEYKEENLKSLPDIERGISAAKLVLRAFQNDSQRLGGSLLSPESIALYYGHYYWEQKGLLDYPVSPEDSPRLHEATTLYDMLSVNYLAYKASDERKIKMPAHLLHQMFDTAGSLVEVFDVKGGADVLVPYQEGETLIAAFLSDPPLGEIPALQRRSQRYLVHLYPGDIERLERRTGALRRLGESGVLALDKQFYDKERGVVWEPRPGKAEIV